MYNPQIQNKIRHFIANQPSNCLNQYSSTFSLELIDSFPQLSPAQIRSLCKAQEQLIIQKVLPMRPYDLYSEIAKVCPEESDLSTISQDEVAQRINLYSSKLVLTQRMTCQSQQEDSWQESKQESFFGDVRFDMCLIEGSEPEQQTMRNILEIVDDQNCWNPIEYFGLN